MNNLKCENCNEEFTYQYYRKYGHCCSFPCLVLKNELDLEVTQELQLYLKKFYKAYGS